MKKIYLSFFLTLSATVIAFGQVDVKIINSTSTDLYGLYTSGTDGDLLPEDILLVGNYATIVYPEGYDCEVTIEITYLNGETEEVAYSFDLDICQVSTLEVFDDYYALDDEQYSYDE